MIEPIYNERADKLGEVIDTVNALIDAVRSLEERLEELRGQVGEALASGRRLG